MPNGYKDHVNRIIKYFHALNSTIANVDESIEQLNYQPQNTINVVDVPTHYAGDVNGNQQNKIKSFLNKKDIKTDVLINRIGSIRLNMLFNPLMVMSIYKNLRR